MSQIKVGSVPAKSLRKIWIVLMLGSLTAFGPLSMDMYLPALPFVAEDFHTNDISCTIKFDCVLIGACVRSTNIWTTKRYSRKT